MNGVFDFPGQGVVWQWGNVIHVSRHDCHERSLSAEGRTLDREWAERLINDGQSSPLPTHVGPDSEGKFLGWSWD